MFLETLAAYKGTLLLGAGVMAVAAYVFWPSEKFIPTGQAKTTAATKTALEGVRVGKGVSLPTLLAAIPAGTKNSWKPEARIKKGFKFEWTDTEGEVWHVHGHEPDPNQANSSSNAAASWVVRIYYGKRNYLLEETTNVALKPTDTDMRDWSRSGTHVKRTHIKLSGVA